MVITPIKGCVIFVRSLISQYMKESFKIASSSVGEDGAVMEVIGDVAIVVRKLSDGLLQEIYAGLGSTFTATWSRS